MPHRPRWAAVAAAATALLAVTAIMYVVLLGLSWFGLALPALVIWTQVLELTDALAPAFMAAAALPLAAVVGFAGSAPSVSYGSDDRGAACVAVAAGCAAVMVGLRVVIGVKEERLSRSRRFGGRLVSAAGVTSIMPAQVVATAAGHAAYNGSGQRRPRLVVGATADRGPR